jgi:ubiquinol-cytochrome c reductase cytochrome c subunit
MILLRPWRRPPLLPRVARLALAMACGAAALVITAASSDAPAQSDAGGARHGAPGVQIPPGVTEDQLQGEGRRLFEEGCSSCHGMNARGIAGRGPSLRGVGEAAADFYLRTGRMPLDDPEDQPRRTESPYSERQIDALILYVGHFGGPKVPRVDAAHGSLSQGFKLFSDSCMGCHQVVGQGGITTTGWVPDLQQSTPVDVAEAIGIGPYVMPKFEGEFSRHEIDSLARYVNYTRDPVDVGGWGIGHIGPIPEGMVAWLLAGTCLLLVIRLIGERTTQ